MTSNKLYVSLLEVLKQDKKERFFSDAGELLRNIVYESTMNMDSDLLKLLLNNDLVKNTFFKNVDGITIFDKTAFAWAINNKEFLPDSYTRFKNKIGLVNNKEEFISSKNDVVLSFPYKDCVLEGGQTKEDQKRGEIFYNEILASDEADRLLAPKVFTNAKKYTKNGEEEITEFSENDNLLIKGNNLLAISSLLEKYEGKIKLIYIDPPYNTGNDSFGYNDRFNHSSWLTFMKNRLEIAKKLLTEDGSIFVHLDYNESHYCKVLLDEIFGHNNFKNEIIWRRKQATSFGSKKFGIVTDSIFYYGKTENTFFNTIYTLDDEHTQNYIKQRFVHKDENGDLYMKSPLVNSLYRPNLKYVFKGINPPNNGWLYSESRMQDFYNNNELIIPNDPNARIYRKIYLKSYPGQEIQSLWTDIPIVNPMADEQEDFQTQKPEKLLQRIIETSTREGDIVLDYHLGSGTTCVVAHKLKRRYIGIEQMDYINEVTKPRLISIIDGEKSGISKNVNWQGGGNFVYCELKENNQLFIDKIASSDTNKDLTHLLNQILETGFISYQVDIKGINENMKEFEELSIEDKKKFLIQLLDKNMLYVNYCDIDDEEYKISETDKAFTKSLYGDA